MVELVVAFVARLRSRGLAIPASAVIDANAALQATGLRDRERVRLALRTCLAKSSESAALFDRIFDEYFDERRVAGSSVPGNAESDTAEATGDDLDSIARSAVARLSGIAPGRFLGAEYHTRRTMRLLQDAPALAVADESSTTLDAWLHEAALARREAAVRGAVEREVHRRDPSGSPRRPLRTNDFEFLRATPADVADLRRTVAALGRRLAARLRRRNRRGHTGSLHARSTIRRSLASGGVPMDPVFRTKRRHRPDVVVLADVSGSVAHFARFTLQLVHALSANFGQLRAFVFVDEIDEVTRDLRVGGDFTTVMASIDARAKTLGDAGHSDYGRVFDAFAARWLPTLRPTTTLIVLGDARNNYHEVRAGAFESICGRCRKVYWFNPEPRGHWDTADSVMSAYAAACDDVYECRTIDQLAAAVDHIS